MIRSKIKDISRICRYGMAGAVLVASLMMGSGLQVMAETEASETEAVVNETADTETTDTSEETDDSIIESVLVTGATRPFGGMGSIII